ncbi:MAG: hypothetical protein AB1627_00985 [Chloroflexota bacterium]
MTTDPKRQCGAKGKPGRTEHCRQPKGFGTSHPGTGRCKFHGGSSPNGRRHARREAAELALLALGVPHGDGDPFALLRDVVRHAHGQVLAVGRLLVEVVDDIREGKTPRIALAEAIALADRTLRTGGLVGKETVDSDVAERDMKLSEEIGFTIHQVLTAALDAAGVAGEARTKAEEALVRELVAVGPSADERN